jgi:formyltetrahydrofolate-dependent phosphoribosylglycinamide formyltransferase (EC 2.1.2.2)
MIKIAIFASGSGSNAENIANYFAESNTVSIPLIISNKKDAYVHERANKLGINRLPSPKTSSKHLIMCSIA